MTNENAQNTQTPQDYLSNDELCEALKNRDLTDPNQGQHAIQLILDDAVEALRNKWGTTIRTLRSSPIVAIANNFDRLGYDPKDVTRARRYTRYISPTTMLRSHTSAEIPSALEQYVSRQQVDELIVVPGSVYRRDVVDRTHVGEPHQLDLWRVRSTAETTDADMLQTVNTLVEAVLPGANWRTTPATHPYTVEGRQVDVWHHGEWLELAECGQIHPDVLRMSGLDPQQWSGLALGMGLERALMLRKGIPDIRYLRTTEPRIAVQMQDLAPWRPVSVMPAIRRDISVVIDEAMDEETIGDSIRRAMGERVDDIESIEVLARTVRQDLPPAAQQRLGIRKGQVNSLVRITLRPLENTLTDAETNQIRNRIYLALHEGPVWEMI